MNCVFETMSTEKGWVSIRNYSAGTCIFNPCTDPNCLSCPVSNSVCTSCITGYQLDGGLCVVVCVSPCVNCTVLSTCLSCASGYYLSGTSCLACTSAFSNCQICTSDGSSCTLCQQGYSLKATAAGPANCIPT